jgi:hypothetical protein
MAEPASARRGAWLHHIMSFPATLLFFFESCGGRGRALIFGYMQHTHLPLVLQGVVVGDLVVAPHGVTFFTVRGDLRHCDGRSYRTADEAAAAVAEELRPGVLRAA